MYVSDEKESLWEEKYRPRTVDDCILPQRLKDMFNGYISDNEIPNMMLSGTQGSGKTTVARALCEEIGCDYMIINCSEDSGIDVLRTTIRSFASTVSLMGNDKKKIVILDEGDYLNANSTQPALRGFMDEFKPNCRFILTCNYKSRIIEPLQSRFGGSIDFTFNKNELPELMGSFMKRIIFILDRENVEYESKAVAEFIKQHYPDSRRIINELQSRSRLGVIDVDLLMSDGDARLDELFGYIKSKSYNSIRKWVAQNSDLDDKVIFRRMYNELSTKLENSSVPQLIIILSEYQYKSAFVADPEINMMACITEIMMNVQFR